MDLQALRLVDIDNIREGLVLGLEQFGPYADWLWSIPVFWAIAAVLMWLHTAWDRQRRDRAYLDYTSRNLSLLRRIALQRAREVSTGRPYDRF